MRKIIDDKGRLFGLISVIDVFVLVVVIILAVVVFMRFSVRESPQAVSNTIAVTYTVKYPSTRYTTYDMLRSGDKLYTESGTYIGTIRRIDFAEATALEPLLDGTFIIAKVQDRIDLTLYVEVQCSHIDGRYYADKVFELNVNSEHKMATKYNLFSGTILSITEG